MINITRNEEVVLNQIKIFNIEYPDGIPLKLLKSELGFHEYDLVQILEELQDKVFNYFKIIRLVYLRVKSKSTLLILKKT